MSVVPEEEKSQHSTNIPKKQSDVWRLNGVFVVVVHLLAFYALFFVRPSLNILLLSLLIWAIGCIGITMGYHRLWSHRTYKASFPLQCLLAVCGTIAFQGSIKWWVQRHRLHHRFTDSQDDPYNATKGFFFSHIGWIFHKPFYPRIKQIDISDLNKNPLIRFQHKYYVYLALLLGFLTPTLIGKSLWNEGMAAFLYCGCFVRLMIWHCTFSINSFAHWIGDQHFSTETTARGNALLALITFGEGHHNFHHSFPSDYRNGVRWWDYDPTKWLIAGCSALGLTWQLEVTPPTDITKTKLHTAKTAIESQMAFQDWGPQDHQLPEMTLDQFQSDKRSLLLFDGYVHDVSEYMDRHPGGSSIMRAHRNKDVTSAFHGGINNHSLSAKLKAQSLRIAKLA